MLTRRMALAGAGAAGACVTAGYAGYRAGYAQYRAGFPSAMAIPKTQVNFTVMPGACDAHVHVIGDAFEFPMSPDRDSTPPEASAEELFQMLRSLNLTRVVIVTPNLYDDDNSATIAAIRKIGRDRTRGVAWVSESASPEVLKPMSEAGIVGFRVAFDTRHFDAASQTKRLHALFDLGERTGWHLDIVAPPDVIAALAKPLNSCPVPSVLDTFGWAADGVTQPGFDAILTLIRSGRAYVKLSEPYRISKKGPDYPDLVPVAQAFVAANPERVLWGSGWPYLSDRAFGKPNTAIAPALPIDTGHLLNLFATWVPDPATRHRILVENPARLYGF
jgi:predicted TIM-barrel fold metal-dependent hydrolase